MSSRFVAAGGADIEPPPENNDWAKAKKQVEESKKPKVDISGTQEGGKSLYEHLQAQKAAKQDAFEEATKLRNQFRPLDDSEVEYLESIKQNERAQVASVRKETAEQLDAFRKEQAKAEQLAQEDASKQVEQSSQPRNDHETWTAAKKRRKPHWDERDGTPKSRRISGTEDRANSTERYEDQALALGKASSSKGTPDAVSDTKAASVGEQSTSKPKLVSTLVGYDSDSDS